MDPVSPPSSSSSSDAEDDVQDTSPSSNLPPDFKDQTEDLSSSGSEPEDDADAGPISMFNVLKRAHVPSRYKAGNPNSNANGSSTVTDDANTVIAEEYNEELEGCVDIGPVAGESYVEVATEDSKLSETETETDSKDNLKHGNEMEDESLADPDDTQEQPEQMATLTETDNSEASDTECPPPLPQSLPPPVAPKPIRINQNDTVTKVEDDIKQSDMQTPDEFDEGDTMTNAEDVDDQNNANLHDHGTTEDSLTMNETVQIRPPPIPKKPKLADRSSSDEHQNINPRTSTKNQESLDEQDTNTSASSTQLETNNQDQLEHLEDASSQDGNIEHENESQDGEERVPCYEGNASADQEIISESMMADMDFKKSMYKTLTNMESFVIVDKEFESGEDTQIVEEPKYNEVDKNEIVSKMANSETTKRMEEDDMNEDNDVVDDEDSAVDDKNDVSDVDEQYDVKLKRTLSEEHEQFSTPQEGLSEDDDENEAEDAKFVDSIDTTEVKDNTQLTFGTKDAESNNQTHNKSTDQAEKSQYLDLGESIVVLGKGTVRGGFISMSSSISESEIAKDEELHEPDVDAEETVELREKITSQVSVKDRRSIFENLQNQPAESNVCEPRKSKSRISPSSSFELLSSVESHLDNVKTNPIKQHSVEEAVDIKPCESIEEMIKDKLETAESDNDENMDKNDIPPAVGPRSLLVQEKRVSLLVEQKRTPPIRPRSQIIESLDIPNDRPRSCERPTPRGRTISEDPTNTQSFAEGFMRPDDELNKTFPLSSDQMASNTTPESSMPNTHQNQARPPLGEPAGQFPDRKVPMTTYEKAGIPGHPPSTLPDISVQMTTKEQTGMPGYPPFTQPNVVPSHSMMPHWYWQQQQQQQQQQQAWQSYYQSNLGQQAVPGFPRQPMNNPQGPRYYQAPPGYHPSMQTPVDQTSFPSTSMPEQSTPRQPVPKHPQPSGSKPTTSYFTPNAQSMPTAKDKNESKDKEQIPLKRKDTPKPKPRSTKTQVDAKRRGYKKSVSIEPKATPRKGNPIKRNKTDGEADRKQEQPRFIPKEKVQEEKQIDQQEFYLYVDGINHTTTKENLENYIESKIGELGTVDGQTLTNLTKTAALIVLEGKPDMVKLKEKIQQRQIDGKTPRVYECTPPTSIVISSEGKIADGVKYYFESPKSGGGELKEDKLEKIEDSGCYKLTFKDAEVVHTLCDGRQHKVDGQNLRVSPCYECKAGSIWDTDLHAIPLPGTFKLDLKPGYSIILQRDCCSDLTNKMEACFCKMKFEDQSVSLECIMTQSTPDVWKLVKTWQQDVKQAFDGYRNENLTEGNVKIEREIWGPIFTFLHSSEFTSDMVIVLPSKHDNTIQLIGFENNVENKKTEIEEKRKALRRTYETRSLKSRHESKQGHFKVKLMETHGFFDELRQEQPDIEINYQDADITITGQPEHIGSAFVKIYEKAANIRDSKFHHGYHSDLCAFISKPKVINEINAVINYEKAKWEIKESEIVVYVYDASEDEDTANDVYGIIKGCIDETSVHFNKEDCRLFADSSSKWLELSQDITERFEDKAEAQFKKQDKAVIVYGFKKDVKSVKKLIEDFLEKNSIREEEVSCKSTAAEFIKKYSMKSITDIQGKNPEHQVKITVNNDSVTVRGTQEGLDVALREVKALVNRMMSDKHEIERIAVWHVLHDEKENGALDTIEKSTKCLIKYPDEFETGYESSRSVHSHNATRQSQGATAYPDSDNDENELETSMASSFKCFKTKNGINVSLVEGEIGKQSGDILVVSTAPSLVLKSGASSKSVLSEGGDELQQKCHQMFPNEIKHGQIAAIPACGQLECQFVYFTSLPNYSEDGSKQILEKFVKDCLATASKHRKKSIVFSAMGTGQLKYPRETVAMIMYQTVIEFDSKNPKTSLKDVQFVLYQKDTETIKVFKDEERLHIEGKGSRPNYDVTVGYLNIQLLVENIAEQKVDGVLCTTSPTMDLKRSGACQALQRVGGKSLQQQCESKYGNKLGEWQVAEIDAGNLQCKSVFLTVMPSYTEESKEGYKGIIQTFLRLAVAKNYTSVALPALGTGFLNYPKLDACKWMYEALTDFTRNNPTTCLKNVRFIMYAKDHSTLQTFRNHVMKLQGKKSRTGRTLSQQSDNQSATGNWSGDRKPAKFNTTKDGCQIREVTLKVKKGDILSEKTEAIVTSVGQPFEFVGAVAQALLQKCPQLKKECGKKNKMQKITQNGLTSTPSYGLDAKHIIHVQFDDTLLGWRKKILKCLEKANRKKWQSLAFPVLGSGAGATSFNPDDIAKELFEAINQFTSGNTHVILKDIRLIVFKGQPQMFDPIIKALHKKTQEVIPLQSSGKMDILRKGWNTAKEYVKSFTTEDKQREKIYSSLTLIIHSDSKDNIDRCKREIDAKLEHAYQEAWIKSYVDVVKSLSDEQVKSIENIPFTVNIKTDKKNGLIKLSGPSKQVGQAQSDILDILRNIDKNQNTKKEAETLYKVVQWQYEEITTTETKLVPYEKMVNYTIEKAYKDNKKKVQMNDNDGTTYVIDFKTLEEYPTNDSTDKMKVIRKDMVKAATESLPAEWSPMKDRENIKLVTLVTTDAAYISVQQRFLSEVKNGKYTNRIQFSLANLTVTKIERIQNKTLYQQYMAKKKLLEQEKNNLPANMPIEREVWHGTTQDVVSSIQNHGFNRSYCGKNGIWFGAGVYFAGDASYSARGWLSGAQGAAATTGIKGYIFLVKALTGQFTVGNKDMRYLPAVDPKKPTVMYDSAVDDVRSPMEFVIFHDTQAYPEYILTFTA